MSEYINGTTDILGGSVIRYALNTTTPNQAVIRKIIAGNGISISSTGVDAGTGDVTISIDTSGTGGSGGSGSGGGGTPTAVGTVTSVNMTVPEGMFVLGAPVTTAGTMAIRLSSGYTVPTYTDVQKGVTAYSWGNHADEGYLVSANLFSDYDYNITGSRDSSNQLYTLRHNYVAGSTRVFVNGVRQTPGALYDYLETGTNTITFNYAPDNGDLITADYIKS